MFDLIATLTFAAVFVIKIIVLVGLSPSRLTTKVLLFALASAWLASIVGIAAFGGFEPGATGRVPGVAYVFVPVVLLGVGAWFLVPPFRNALTSLPLPALVGMHAARVFGIYFVILWELGRLSAPFAPIAGWGDVLAGATAVPVALALRRGAGWAARAAPFWNAFGTLDLVVAVALGVLSAPGTAFRVFVAEPGTLTMGTLPWVLVPTVLVPLFLLDHLVIAVKLRGGK